MEPNGPADIVRWMDENLFHFSCKTVNSNTAAGGVRLGADQALDLPYVSARTLLSEGRSIGLDYLVNAGSDATVFKRVRQSIGEIDPNDIDGPVFRQAVSEKYQVLSGQHRERGLDSVSPRLRQLLIPVHGQARYVALTPLGSAGLCETVKAVSRQRQEERKAEIKVGSPIGFDSASLRAVARCSQKRRSNDDERIAFAGKDFDSTNDPGRSVSGPEGRSHARQAH
jgi:hypothetical protein